MAEVRPNATTHRLLVGSFSGGEDEPENAYNVLASTVLRLREKLRRAEFPTQIVSECRRASPGYMGPG